MGSPARRSSARARSPRRSPTGQTGLCSWPDTSSTGASIAARATTRRYAGLSRTRSSWVPSSVTRPFSKSTTRSAWWSHSGDDGADHGGPPVPDGSHAGGDPRLGVGVDRRGGLDQHEDGCVGGERPREHDPLALAAGQPAATLVEHALPAARERVVHVLGVGHAHGLLGLGAGQPAVRVDGVLERAGEELAAGVADQDLPAYVVQRGRAQVDAAELDPPLTVGQLLVEGGQAGALGEPLRPGATGCATLDALLELLADRLGVGRQVAAQPVGEGGTSPPAPRTPRSSADRRVPRSP